MLVVDMEYNFADDKPEPILSSITMLYTENPPPARFSVTPLAGHLIGLGVDTILVTGCTTSGCVRASVVDAHDYRFRTVVVEDCIFDRAPTPHRLNLFDMAQKYAVVRPFSHVEEWLGHVRTRR